MADHSSESAICTPDDLRAVVSVHMNRITDACLDKDCIEDLRVYLTQESQAALDRSTNAKARCAELLHVYIDVAPVQFNRGYYAVDLTFYYRVIGDTVIGGTRPTTIYGLAIFSKRVVLYGGEDGAKIFSSHDHHPGATYPGSRIDTPEAIVEILDPMILRAKVTEVCEHRHCEADHPELPADICSCFDDALVFAGEAKRMYVTIGQFSTVRLERGAQLSVPTCDYCIPEKECCGEEKCEEDPCEMFSKIEFPYETFYPSNSGNYSCGS